ncbi:MAG TPA: YqgQ family protein [Bacillota bacterium]|nr:YqgQ family protein [Bacillota bacterium]
MNNMLDVRQLLKRFGTFIYIGDREADLQLMQAEIHELYSAGCISAQEYQDSLLIIRKEKNNLQDGKGANAYE